MSGARHHHGHANKALLDAYTGTTPNHATNHQNGGADEISVAGLSGELADPQPPKTHAASHTNGTDDIQNATNAQKGLATAAHITALEAALPAAGGTVTGNLTRTNSNDIVTAGALSNDTGSGGKVLKIGSGSTTAGDCYFFASGGGWTQVDADAEATSKGLLAMAIGTDPDADGMFVGPGLWDADDTLTGWGAGKDVYLSTTAGKLTTTAPSGSADIVRIVGHCTSVSGEIWFAPSPDYIEIA